MVNASGSHIGTKFSYLPSESNVKSLSPPTEIEAIEGGFVVRTHSLIACCRAD
ncbi:hypothetical protein CI41S_39890 [Bradyrhizobium ivorense]|nr:hypothetical protein CI41S_39890 [Bradyrhizobium ivorense]